MTGADIIAANEGWLDEIIEGVMFGMRCITGRSRLDGFGYAVFWRENTHVQCPLAQLCAAEAASIRAQLDVRASVFGRRSISDMLNL